MEKMRVLNQLTSLNKIIAREFMGNCRKDIVPLTPTQLVIMDYIFKSEEKDVLQKDLESVLNLRRATVSGVLQTMEKNGLITRVVCDSDARVKKIVLNLKAEEYVDSYKDKIKLLEKNLVKDISEEEIEMFLNIAKKMQENIINYGNNK